VITKAKLPEIRKEAFTKARESLGLSTKDLSGLACLSTRQIEQIENGESSSFYGDQVKFTAAKKVAGLLKLKPEDAFDFGEAQASDSQINLQGETIVPVVEKKAKSEKVNETEQVKEKPEVVSVAKVFEPMPASVSGYSDQAKPSGESKKKGFLLLAIGAAVIFSVVNLRPLFFPEPVKEEVVIIQEVAQEAPPTNVPAEPAPDLKPAPAVMAQPELAVISTECPPADASILNYKPEAPKKAGDMVYLQSKTAQTVCVVDAAGRTQNKALEPGIGVSVFGKPPLKVLTGGLNQVDMYYQGARVRIGNTTGKTIILEPAEIVQPVALPASTADSQVR